MDISSFSSGEDVSRALGSSDVGDDPFALRVAKPGRTPERSPERTPSVRSPERTPSVPERMSAATPPPSFGGSGFGIRGIRVDGWERRCRTVFYRVTVYPDDRRFPPWRVWKRYSQFLALRTWTGANMPFPPKRCLCGLQIMGATDGFLHTRKHALEQWLGTAVEVAKRSERIAWQPILTHFCTPEEETPCLESPAR
jgi:hypothetical protein